jgi:predicted DNA binding CopG/RHH family protein
MSSRPIIRPSARRAADAAQEAAKLEKDSARVVLVFSRTTRKNLKVRAAQEGLTVKAYLLRLLERDGVECVE